jgi:tRNA-specific 2-thiouridylase
MSRAKTCLVAMSGGVDSSVCAALLLEQGYTILGVTLNLFDGDKAEETIKDAKRVAEHLKIEHRILDLRLAFSKTVINPFIRNYEEGYTPNPCVACNKSIKFGALFDYAMENGIEYLATGHYARVEYSDKYKRYVLMTADVKKDQSYVLYHLNQDKLSHLLLPLGSFDKETIRSMAKAYNLPVAEKKESQEICFVPNDDYISYILPHVKKGNTEGNIVDMEGKVIGRHKGLIHYTIGQRKGLGGFGRPVFIREINSEANELVLCDKGKEYFDIFYANDLYFSAISPPVSPLKVQVKIRYKAPFEPCTIYPAKDGIMKIIPDRPLRAVTPGQAVVFYDGEVVLGGGTIIKL